MKIRAGHYNWRFRNCSFTMIFLAFFILAGSPGLLSQNVGVTGDSTINRCETKSYTISILNNSGNDLTSLFITAHMVNLTGFSYESGTSSIDVDGGVAFCTVDPTPSGTDLIWDIDGSCPGGPFTLNNGSTLNITFQLSTDCSAVSGSLNVDFDYEIGGTPLNETGALNIQVNPGAVTIKKTPNVFPQRVGQDVTWTLTVENTGFGVIENVEVTDILGAGLAYVSSTQNGNNSGQTTTWTSNEYAALASMDPGDILTMDITATVIACQFLDNNADVRFGCSPSPADTCFDTSVTGGTATASVQRIVTSPLIQYTPPDISFTYCTDTESVSFTISNIGDGSAYDLWISVDFGSMTVSNVSSGVTYNNASKRFEFADPIPPSGTYTLSFDLTYSTWCGGSFPAGNLVWQNVYKDECSNDFYPPVELSVINAPADSPSLSVTKGGAGSVIQIADQVTYTITSAFSGPLACGTGTAGLITVVDTIPDGFTVIDAGDGIWVPGTGGIGGTVTWTYMPPASLNTSIIVQSPLVTDCETYCNTIFLNSVTASGTDCCGCPLNASASETTAIECEEGVESDKTYSGPTERCDDSTYTNTYIFSSGSTVLLTDLQFEEHAENSQQYVPGSLLVTLSGSGDITASVVVTDNTPVGSLLIDFSGAPATPLAGQTLTIVYDLTATDATVAACGGSTFYSWSSLEKGASGSACLSDGIIHETVPVSIVSPGMSVSVSGLGTIVHKCETETITINLSQVSQYSDPKDVRLVLSGLNYYVTDPSAVICSGTVAPVSCIPTINGSGDYVWEFGDAFTGSGQTATLQMSVQKRCSGNGDLTATAYFDDRCTDDSTVDELCSVSDSDSPVLLLSGDLLIEKTPEVYYANTNQVEWVIYVTNRGSGTAYNVWVDDVLGSGLDYVSAVVDNMTGVIITADQDHGGNATNGATISIAEMAAGERRKITFTATLIDCNNLTNDVSTSWGCIGVECQTVVTDNSIVQIPAPNLINTNTITPSGGVDACSSPDGFITLRNAGQVTCYNLQVTETLPANLLYVPGSTRWRLNGGAWNGPNAAYDPSPTTSPLVWTPTQIPGLATSSPGDTIEIEFEMTADCPFTGGNITVSTQYENPCADVFTTSTSTFTASFNAPTVTITKTRANTPINCGELIEWTITVQNTSGYTLPVIWVEDILDASYTYDSSVGDPPFTADNGTNAGQTITWELRNVAHNDTVVLTLRATTDTSPCSPDLDNTARAWWGCGAADGSSATKPGVDPPDNNICLTATSVSDVRTETREPGLSYFDIAMSPLTIDSCNDSTELTITIENTGPTDARNVDLVLTLPPGLTYNAGTSQSGLSTDQSAAIILLGAIGDPAVSGGGTILTWYDIGDKVSDIADTIQASGGNDTLVLRFSVQSSCYVTDDIDISMYYYDCCDDTQYSSDTSTTVTSNYPDLTVTKTPASSQVECGTNQTWTITVTNNGTGNAEVVRVEDTLSDWIDHVSSTPAATSMGGQVYGWEINNLASGASAIFTITGQLNPDGLPNQADCDQALRQNNVEVFWGCGTSGDAIDNDPMTTGYDCQGIGSVTAAPANLLMPDLRVTDIEPVISCVSDGVFSGTLRVRVRNSGNGTSLNNFTVQVTDGKGWTGTGTYTGTISAGSQVWVTIDTSAWAPGCHLCSAPYAFTATVDLNNDVCECNETNNTRFENYTTPIPDLTVTDIDFTNISCTNDTMSGNVRVQVQNTGCVTAANIPVSLTTDGCFSFPNVTIASLAAGATTWVTFNISGSWGDCSAEECEFTATVDPSGIICECDGTNNSRTETYSTTLPDLVVTDIDFSNVSCSGDNISGTVDVTIQNTGFGSANNFEVSLATDGCLTFSNETVSTALTNGQSTTVTFTVGGSWSDCTDCSCDFTATVDATNVICECNGTNNQRTESFTQTRPDLRVNTVTPSASCVSDGNLTGTVTVNVENIGCADANSVVVRLTSDCGITFTDQTVNLAQGATSDLTFNYTPVCSACTCTFTAAIDPDNSICECSSGNNSLASAPYTMNVPDIEVLSDTLAVSCSGDGQVRVSGNITLVNNGCGANLTADVPMRITMYDNTGCSGNVIDQWTQTFSGVNIASGGGAQSFAITAQTVTTNLVNNSTSCQVSFRIEADYSGTICECDGTDNVYCTGNKNVDIPDLEVSADTLGVSCLSDGQVTVSGTVTMANNGCGSNMISNIPVRFTLYDNTGCTGNVIQQWTQTFAGSNIPAGGGTQVFTITPRNITANMVSNSTGCQVSIRVEADYTNTICESDGTDNTYCADNKAIDIPDIEVQSDSIVVSCTDDGDAAVTGNVTLVNNGCGPDLMDDISMRFTIYDNTGCSGNQIHQWTETFSAVNIAALGGTQVFAISSQSLTLNMIANSTNCRVSVLIEPDYTGAICESDGNNSACSDKDVVIPDLNVNSSPPLTSCFSDGNLQVQFVVSNEGCADINTSFNVRISDNAGHTRTVSFTALGGTLPLVQGGSQTITIDDWDFDCASGTIDFDIILDVDNDICESGSANNTVSFTHTLSEPDLLFGTVTSVCNSNATIDFTIPVENQGYGDATGVVLNVYDDTALIYTQTFNLASGTTTTIGFTSGPYQGDIDHHFRFVLDEAETVCECNGSNNEAAVTVNCPTTGLVTGKTVLRREVSGCSEVEFTLTAANVGFLNAYNIVIQDILPRGFKYIAGSTSAAWPGGTYSSDPVITGNTLEWNIGTTLFGGTPTGDSLTLTFRAVSALCSEGNRFVNSMRVTGDDGAGVPIPAAGSDADDNDPDDSSSADVILLCPELEVIVDCPATEMVAPGELFETTITVTNKGDNGKGFRSLTITDLLPEGWVLDSFTSEGGVVSTGPAPGDENQLTWNYSDLSISQNERIVLKLRLKADSRACGTTGSETITVNSIDRCGEEFRYSDSCPVTVICGEPVLKLDKTCSRAEQPGGIYTFGIILQNTGTVPADNIRIEDTLPAGFVYVEGSSVLNGNTLNDPSGNGTVTWEIGMIDAGETLELSYQLIAPADIDPGEYCNEAKAFGVGQDRNPAVSNTARCCTVLRRDLSGCCIDIEHWARGFYYIPDLPMAFVDPYFVTEDAMFTVYSVMDFLKRIDFGDDSLAQFVRDRLKNYALSTIEEFYLRSKQGVEMKDGSIWLSYASSYPETGKDGWKTRKVDKSMTSSQIAFELLALNSTLAVNDDQPKNEQLNRIMNDKLRFITDEIKQKFTHRWTLGKKGAGTVDENLTFFDLSSLYLASIELNQSGVEGASELTAALKDRFKMTGKSFDKDNIPAELISVLAMLSNGDQESAKAKMREFEKLLKDGKITLKTMYDYSLAVHAGYRTGQTFQTELFEDMKDRFYNKETGIFSESQADFTRKLSLKDFGALLLAFESRLPDSKEFFTTTFYRMVEETGLFLTKRNLFVENPPLNLLKNYPFGEDILPMLSFIKGEKTIAPVFTNEAVVYTPDLKPLGTDLFPFRFSRILSPAYETDSAKIASLSYMLQDLGSELGKEDNRILREKGRSLSKTGRGYIDSLMVSGAGLEKNGVMYLPLDRVAVKGPRNADFNLEPLDRGYSFSLEALADYVIAEKFYIEGDGDQREALVTVMEDQKTVLSRLEAMDPVPARFIILFGSDQSIEKIIPLEGAASKLTLAKLFFLSGNAATRQKLSGMSKIPLRPEDMIFLKIFADSREFFRAEMEEYVAAKQPGLTGNSAKLLSAKLLEDRRNSDPDLLKKLWDDDIALPLTEKTDRMKGGVIHHYDAVQLMLYLYSRLGEKEAGFSFDRTLGFLTYLVENEWGIRGDSGYASLPASVYWVIKQDPRENPEPGDHISFRVRVENRCPLSLARGKDIPSLFIKAFQDPGLPYSGTEDAAGLDVISEYNWKYDDLNEGNVLEFTYESLIPEDFNFNYFRSTVTTRGFTAHMDTMPEEGALDFCEDTDTTEGWRIVPMDLITGIVFEDRNANGRRDSGERGIPGILVRDTRGKIYRSDTEGQFIVPTGGDIIGVQIDLDSVPSNFLMSSSPTFLLNRYSDTIPLFALIPCTVIDGFVFEDLNANGVFDQGDRKAGNIVLEAGKKEVVTSGEGGFVFYNIPLVWVEELRVKAFQPFSGQKGSSLKIVINKRGTDK